MIAQRTLPHTDQQRAVPRTSLLVSATIRFGQVSAAIRLRDLSADGVRIEGALLPEIGATAVISRGTLVAGGTIVWRDRNSCGLRFDSPLPLDAWLPGRRAAPSPPIVEAAAAHTSTPPDTSTLNRRLAEELAYVSRLLESLGDDRSGEALIVMRHGEKLQGLDLSTQILGHVAAVLTADTPDDAVAGIGLGSLRKRLQRVSL